MVKSLPGSGRSPGEGIGNPLQYSCLENPVDRGARRATARGATESWTRLSDVFTLPLPFCSRKFAMCLRVDFCPVNKVICVTAVRSIYE